MQSLTKSVTQVDAAVPNVFKKAKYVVYGLINSPAKSVVYGPINSPYYIYYYRLL